MAAALARQTPVAAQLAKQVGRGEGDSLGLLTRKLLQYWVKNLDFLKLLQSDVWKPIWRPGHVGAAPCAPILLWQDWLNGEI